MQINVQARFECLKPKEKIIEISGILDDLLKWVGLLNLFLIIPQRLTLLSHRHGITEQCLKD